MNEFIPDWASPPGDSIKDLMDAWDIDESELCMLLEITECDKLLKGEMEISGELAEKLATYLGGTKQFWLNRENIYRDDLKRLNKDKDL